MSYPVNILGVILIQKYESIHGENIIHHNLNTLNAFKVLGYPPLSTSMFNLNGLLNPASLPSYELIPLPFSGTYKNLFYEWQDWLNKFEALLKELIWSETYVHYHGMPNNFSYYWRINNDSTQRIRDGNLQNNNQWEFSGGPRSFDSLGK